MSEYRYSVTNRKPKRNYKSSASIDNCQTPDYALAPLLSFVPSDWIVWESAMGEGNLCRALADSGRDVIGTDIQMMERFNFFEYDPERDLCKWDVQITNPPYSIKYQWLQRSYELGKPFALLIPVESIGAAKGNKLIARYGAQFILFTQRVNFKMPNKGYEGSAQFPTLWWTSGLNIPQQISVWDSKERKFL